VRVVTFVSWCRPAPERRPDWQAGKLLYMLHFSTGDAAKRWYDEPLEVGALIESGTYEVWRVEQLRHVEGLGRVWAYLMPI
jgi:hypothetical protein